MTRCRCCGATIDAAVLVAAFVGVSPLSCADSPWIGTVTAATDYVFRDVSQTHGRAALQGGVQLSEQAYPEVTLEIIADTLLIDIVGAGVDAGVRFEEHLAEDIVAVSRSRPQRYVVASPALLAARGQPSAPKDLHAQPCIATRCPSGLLPAWEFEKAGRTLKIMPRGPLVSSSSTLLLRAAIDGLGFLMTFQGYARQAIAAGQLATVLDDWSSSFPGPFLYYPSRRQLPSSLVAFVAFAKEWRNRPDAEIRPGRGARARASGRERQAEQVDIGITRGPGALRRRAPSGSLALIRDARTLRALRVLGPKSAAESAGLGGLVWLFQYATRFSPSRTARFALAASGRLRP